MNALLPPGDVAFMVGVLVALVCLMIGFVEWFENRDLLIAFVMIGVAILMLFLLLATVRLW